MLKAYFSTIALLMATLCQGQVTFTEYSIPTPGVTATEITVGPDGNLWFIENRGPKIGRITSAGVITEFPIPSGGSPQGITAGPDGNLWFTEYPSSIGRITPGGVITDFTIPTFLSEPIFITAGPDGNLWFTEANANDNGSIGRITPDGVITEFPVPRPASGVRTAPWGIVAGSDGNLWFTEFNGNNVGRITPSGIITEFPIPSTPPFNCDGSLCYSVAPSVITLGPDGNLWFTEFNANNIGKITTSGVITEFPVPTTVSLPYAITLGPDKNLWFTAENGNQLSRITTAGVVTMFPIPTPGVNTGIVTGPDGNLWFIEYDANKIAKVTFAPVSSCTFSLSPSGQSFSPQGGLGSFAVNAGPSCSWKAVPSASWITILPSGSNGTGKVNYAIAANTGGARTATISVGGQNYNIDQQEFSCTYSINPTVAALTNSGGTARTVVSAPAGCPWRATSNAGWITVTSGASGSGSGQVIVSVAPNAGVPRSGTVTIAGKTFAVTEGAGACGALDVTSQVRVSQGPLILVSSVGGKLYDQNVSVPNTSSNIIRGPVYLVLIGLPTHFQSAANPDSGLFVLKQGTTLTTCFTAGGDYLIPISGDLQPGQSVSVVLNLVDGWGLAYTPKVLSGQPTK